MSLLSPASLEHLKRGKNLLAFSAGVDSSALFFLLMDAGIAFDIAHIDYRRREQSAKEAAHARALAARYAKACYLHTASLPDSNFEHEARKVRYAFFEKIIADKGYSTLITAHQLNDRLEWFLMQLGKGAGLVEMLGFEELETRAGYTLCRPLIQTDRDALLAYLHANNLPYFIDESNHSPAHTRNQIRRDFATPLLKRYKAGIRRSFTYLQKDKDALFSLDILAQHHNYYQLQRSGDDIRDLRQTDRLLKRLGYLLSAAQKEEILRQGECVVGGRFVVAIAKNRIHIAPYSRAVMPKSFKEACRRAKIPPKIRPYLYETDYPL